MHALQRQQKAYLPDPIKKWCVYIFKLFAFVSRVLSLCGVCVCCVRCARRSQISANSHVHEMLPWHAVIRHAKQNPMAIRTENGRESDRRMQNTHFMPLSLLVASCWLLQQIQQYKLLFAHSSFADIFCFCIVIRCHCLSLSIWLWRQWSAGSECRALRSPSMGLEISVLANTQHECLRMVDAACTRIIWMKNEKVDD